MFIRFIEFIFLMIYDLNLRYCNVNSLDRLASAIVLLFIVTSIYKRVYILLMDYESFYGSQSISVYGSSLLDQTRNLVCLPSKTEDYDPLYVYIGE